MARYQAESIVLRNQDFGETDVKLTLFTREKGKVEGILKSARKSTSKLGGVCQVFNTIQISYFAKEHTELCKIIQTDIQSSREIVRFDLKKYSLASLLMEILIRTTGAHETNEELYELIQHYLDGFKQVPDDYLWSLSHWIRLLQITGFAPLLSQCVKCYRNRPVERTFDQGEFYFDTRRGGLLCTTCRRALTTDIDLCVLNPETLHFFSASQQEPLGQMSGLTLSPADSRLLFALLYEHSRHQLEGDFKSIEFLRQMWSVPAGER